MKTNITPKELQGFAFNIYQCQPLIEEGVAFFKIKKDSVEKIDRIHDNLNDDVERFFHTLKKEKTMKDYWGDDGEYDKTFSINEICLFIQHFADGIYLKYPDIYHAFTLFAPYLTNSRFFLSSENECWVDEYIIKDGVVSWFRHLAESEYWDDEYKVFEEIAESETENSNFHLMLSNMYLGYADIYDERDFDEKDDIDKERIEQLSIIDKALFYNPNNKKAQKLKQHYETIFQNSSSPASLEDH